MSSIWSGLIHELSFLRCELGLCKFGCREGLFKLGVDFVDFIRWPFLQVREVWMTYDHFCRGQVVSQAFGDPGSDDERSFSQVVWEEVGQ